MDVARVRFRISSGDAIRLSEFFPPYDAFLLPEPATGKPGNPDIDITIVDAIEFSPTYEGRQTVFDCGEGWTLFRDREHYTIVMQASPTEEPLCVARAPHDFSAATVFCGAEFRRVDEGGMTVVSNAFTYPLDQIFLMNVLATHQGVIVHAAGAAHQGSAYLFPGVSGAGKSTLSLLLADVAGMDVLSDDRMVLRVIDGRCIAYGTPWPGDAGFAVNDGAGLGGIFFLHKAPEWSVTPLSPLQAVKQLLPVASIPLYDREMTSQVLQLCEEIARTIPAYDLFFTSHEGIADRLLALMGA